ncbi:MAG: hypothetical protein HDS23_00955 [Bacteroides sp.]|nr:hypothetical protein [Bacteroides sp.]
MYRFLFLFLLFLMSGVVMTGCSDNELRKDEPVLENPSDAGIERALATADAFFDQMGFSTRSNGRRVASVETLSSSIYTRGESSDTLLYLINYENNKGFALISSELAGEDIYAISPKGNLTLADIESNPILSDFLNDVAIKVTYDSALTQGEKIVVVDKKRYSFRVTDAKGPLLSGKVSNWNQLSPYNAYTPIVDTIKNGTTNQYVHGYVGCGPLSLTMLMSYYEHPKKSFPYGPYNPRTAIEMFTFNWDNIYNDTIFDVKTHITKGENYTAKMLAFVGNKMGAKYEKNWTSTAPVDLGPTLVNLKYKDSFRFDNIGFKNIIDSVANFILFGSTYDNNFYKSAPVLAWGDPISNGERHIWVIDGVVTRERREWPNRNDSIANISWTPAPPLFHCVWGWGKAVPGADGYYQYVKNENRMDSLQYNTSGQVTDTPGGISTGYKINPCYKNWGIFGGLIPE